MAFEKIWLGTTSTVPTLATNWQKISVVNAAYAWTVSGSGTNEYYLRTAASGDPGILEEPGAVYIDGTLADEGTLGSLPAGDWGYGDNDSLGYDTLYVRLSGGGDPDAQTRDHVQFQAIPTTGDNVTLSASAVNGIAGVDWTTFTAGKFEIEKGFRNLPVGSQLTPFRIKPNTAPVLSGGGNAQWFIDFGSAAVSMEIRDCPRVSTGYGLNITGSALATVTVDSGSVAFAGQPGDTATITTFIARSGAADWLIDSGVTVTTVRVFAGVGKLRASATTCSIDGGELTIELAAAMTTFNIRGGIVTDKSTGTHGTVTQDGGVFDTMLVRAAKTITTYKFNAGTFRENIDLLTITTRSEPDFPGPSTRTRL